MPGYSRFFDCASILNAHLPNPYTAKSEALVASTEYISVLPYFCRIYKYKYFVKFYL